jgi:lysophosphatidate acyltransferase
MHHVFHFSFLGYRNHSGKIDEFKKGAFRLAIQGQVPILPMVVSSYNEFLDPKKKMFNSGRVIIEILPEIPTVDLKVSDTDSLMQKTRNAMVKKFDELNHEIRLGNKSK